MSGVKATVQKVVEYGPHGPYAIATTKETWVKGSITFSLECNVWQEDSYPEPGEEIYLDNLREKRQGWRAKFGRYWNPSDEQTAQEKESMKRIDVLIESIRNKFMPMGDNLAWKRWVDAEKERDGDDLVDLLSTDVKDEFKKRALYLLLVPSDDLNPIYWKSFYHRDFYVRSFNIDILKKLSPELLNYVADIVTQFYKKIVDSYCNVDYGSKEYDDSIFSKIPKEYEGTMKTYNYCILKLFELVNLEVAEKIFPFYCLNEFYPLRTEDHDWSNYTPFCNLMLDKKVDERIKMMADKIMRRIIANKEFGEDRITPRWKTVFGRYIESLDVATMQEASSLPYSMDLAADQLKFIMDNGSGFPYWNFREVYSLFSEGKYRELRHQMARHYAFKGSLNFLDFELMFKILGEFGNEDAELKNKIMEGAIKQKAEKEKQE